MAETGAQRGNSERGGRERERGGRERRRSDEARERAQEGGHEGGAEREGSDMGAQRRAQRGAQKGGTERGTKRELRARSTERAGAEGCVAKGFKKRQKNSQFCRRKRLKSNDFGGSNPVFGSSPFLCWSLGFLLSVSVLLFFGPGRPRAHILDVLRRWFRQTPT